ncbi:MAG TPA: cupin domain-containing protein [Candidatus Dormibacteraeota bacterium]
MEKHATSQHLWLASESKGYRQTKPGMHRRILTGDDMMVALWRIKDGAGPTPYDNHPHNEQFGIILRGRLDFRINGERHVLGPGDVYWAPKGCDHGDSRFVGDAETGECWIADIFTPPREDYRDG